MQFNLLDLIDAMIIKIESGNATAEEKADFERLLGCSLEEALEDE